MSKRIDDKEIEQHKDLKTLDRIDGKYIWSQISMVTNFDSGIFYTTRELVIRPGHAVKEFLFHDRSRMVRPIVFLIICSLVYTIFQQLFHYDNGYSNLQGFEDSAVSTVMNWIQRNFGYANILMSIFIAICIKSGTPAAQRIGLVSPLTPKSVLPF